MAKNQTKIRATKGAALHRLRTERQLSQTEAAKKAQYSLRQWQRWENGQWPERGEKRIEEVLCSALNAPPTFFQRLADGDTYENALLEQPATKFAIRGGQSRPLPTFDVPLWPDELPAGAPRLTEITNDDLEQLRASGEMISVSIPGILPAGTHCLAMRVRGDSMEPRYPEGTLIFVDLRPGNPKDLIGKPVVAWVNNEEGETFKMLKQDEGKKFWILHPLNEEYPDRLISKNDRAFRVFQVVAVLQGMN